VTDTIKAATAEREAFLADASNLGRPGVVVDPATFTQHVEAMLKGLDAAELLERAPKALATLVALKLKQASLLERRVTAAWVTLGDPKQTTARDETMRMMADLVKLADHSADIDAAAATVIPPDISQLYTHGKLAAFDARRKEVLIDAANVMASGKELDTARVQRLEQMRSLRAAMTEAVPFELAMRKAEPLSRWVDWTVEAAELKTVFDPYRETVAGMFEAQAAPGDVAPSAQWAAIHARYAPVMQAVVRTASYADYCAALPTGWPGNAGRLVTPLDGSPFAAERHAAFCLKLWARYEQAGDSRSAALVGDTLAARAKAK
jgi:hypothetical protein